jgi:hypothetical protein
MIAKVRERLSVSKCALQKFDVVMCDASLEERVDEIWDICFQLYRGGKISAEDRLELDQICSEHIAASVDLRWHILSTGTRGRVSLKGITLTPEMLDLVRMSPLQWGMYYFFFCILLIF